MSKEAQKNVFIVRHGLTDENKNQRLQGWKDTPLSDEGRIQAHRAAYVLNKRSIFSVSSSDLERAVETAAIIRTSVGAAWHRLPDLRERDYGEWEGESVKVLQDSFGPLWFQLEMAGMEPLEDFSQRVVRGFNEALKRAQHLGGNIAIVTHGGPIQEMLKLIGKKTQGLGYEIPNGSITLLKGPTLGTLHNFTFVNSEVPPPYRNIVTGLTI